MVRVPYRLQELAFLLGPQSEHLNQTQNSSRSSTQLVQPFSLERQLAFIVPEPMLELGQKVVLVGLSFVRIE